MTINGPFSIECIHFGLKFQQGYVTNTDSALDPSSSVLKKSLLLRPTYASQ